MTLYTSAPRVPARGLQHHNGTGALIIGVGVCIFLLATLYMRHMLDRGWIPHDEGLLAQGAERVLSGEMPHRDFDEAYTGGLSYLNALAFRIWGVNLMSLRIMLFAFFMVWVPCFYYCATRLLPPISAGAVTLAAVAWGPPNYAAAVPSWYNLFFATAVLAAMFRFLEVRSRVWLFVAGVLAGVSCLVKVVGLYSIAAVLLFLLFYDRTDSQAHPSESPARSRTYYTLVIGAMAIFAFALWQLVRPRLGQPEAVHFLVPGLLISWLVVAEEGRGPGFPVMQRIRSLARVVTPFAVGVVLPIALFLWPFVSTDNVGTLWTGLTHQPLKRLVHAGAAPPPLVFLIPALCLAAAAVLATRRSRFLSVVVSGVVAVLFAFLLVEASYLYAYQLAWQSFYGASPFVIALGVWSLQAPIGRSLPPRIRQQAALVLSSLALFTLIQFPFSSPIYFCYVASVLFLAVASVAKLAGGLVKEFGVALIVFALVFPVFRVTPGFVYNMGLRSRPDEQRTRLTTPRSGGLRVTEAEAEEYSALVSLVQAHSAPGSTILAMPDAPEVYFLTHRQNPTRLFFDFFDPSYPSPENALRAIRSGEPALVVLNSRPAFSYPVDPVILDEAALSYPRAATVGRFTVRWK